VSHVICTIGWFDYTLINGCYKLLLVKGVLSSYVVLGLTLVLFLHSIWSSSQEERTDYSDTAYEGWR
jgi:hypothetical protein